MPNQNQYNQHKSSFYRSELPVTAYLFRDRALAIPFYARVIGLQPSHPIVGAGLQEHSTVFADPFRRAIRTTQALVNQLYSEPEELGKRIREWHRDVKGTDNAGKAYHALDPVPWAWVHLSTFDAVLYALKSFDRLPSHATQEIMYQEWKAAGKSLGVKDKLTPPNLDAYRDYLQNVIENELTATENLRTLWQYLETVPLSDLPGMTKLGEKIAQKPLGHLGQILVGHALPKHLQQALGFNNNLLERVQHDALMTTLKTANAALPEKLRIWPEALGKPASMTDLFAEPVQAA